MDCATSSHSLSASTFFINNSIQQVESNCWWYYPSTLHPSTAWPLRSISSTEEGGCLLQTEAALVFTKNLLKSSSCTFGTKSELAVAWAKVSALSGAARGKEFQLGEKSCSDGWMILSSICNSSPSMPSPVPARIKECVRPPSQLQIYSKSLPGWDFTVIHNDLWSLWQVSVLARLSVSHSRWRENRGNKGQLHHNSEEEERKKEGNTNCTRFSLDISVNHLSECWGPSSVHSLALIVLLIYWYSGAKRDTLCCLSMTGWQHAALKCLWNFRQTPNEYVKKFLLW